MGGNVPAGIDAHQFVTGWRSQPAHGRLMRLRLRIVGAAVGAPLVAAAPFLLVLPVVNWRLMFLAYAAAFVLGLIALIALDALGWLVLQAFIGAGVVVSLLMLVLLPTLQALAVGGWQAPRLLPNASTPFVLLMIFAGAAAGAYWWWMVEPYLWPSTEELIAHLDEDD